MSVNVGELRSQCAYQDGKTPVIVITNDPQLRHLKLRVVQFFPDTQAWPGGPWGSVFKIKIEVDEPLALPE